ncbi:hypothetical protein GJV07_02200 [Enterobacteriaceae bacterium RIT711]|nr:hypothetical protein [Enterobacteriaceae bacterium RIT711]
MSDYYVILTDAGQALMAAATAGGAPVILSQFGVDDGNGVVITPDPAQTTLVNEVYRGDISSLMATGNTIKAQLVIPKDSGGYTVQGFGLYTDDGTLFSVCNFPAQEKPLPSSGYAVKMDTDYYLQVSDTSVVTLQFDGDDYLTREQADTIYLQIGNNLSEIAAGGAAAQAEALDNLGAGTAAVADVQISTTDTTAGRAMTVGAFGIGGSSIPIAPDVDFNVVAPSGFIYGQESGPTSGVYFGFNARHQTTYQLTLVGRNSRFFAQTCEDGDFQGWAEFYTTLHKPTAADTGALSLTGGTLTGNDGILILRNKTLDSANYLFGQNSDGTNRWYIGNGSPTSSDVSINNYASSANIKINEDGTIELNTASSNHIKVTGGIYVPLVGAGSWTSQNDLPAPLFQTIDSTQGSQYQPIFKQHYVQADSTWSGGMLISEGNFHVHYIDAAGKDAGFTFNKDGTFSPTSYANFDARYIRNIRQGTKGSFPTTGDVFNYEVSGAYVTGGYGDGNDSDIDGLNYRPLQITHDGSTYTTIANLAATASVQILNTGIYTDDYPVSNIQVLVNCQPYRHALDESNRGYLIDEQGFDWYRGQRLLNGSIFIAYNATNGIISQIDNDIGMLWPVGLSVTGLESLPENCSIDGTWIFNGTEIFQDADLLAANIYQKNTDGLQARLRPIVNAAFMLQASAALNVPREGDTDSLLAFQQYADALRDVDLTQAEPVWPPRPEIIS